MSDEDTDDQFPVPSVDGIRDLAKRVIDVLPADGPTIVVVVAYVTGFMQYMLVDVRKTVKLETFMKVAKLGFTIGRREAKLGQVQRSVLDAQTIAADALKKAKDPDA